MPQSSGPKLANKENLMFTYQPGGSTPFNNFTASLAEDAAAPKRGTVQGPRRKNAEYTSTYDDANPLAIDMQQRVPVLSLQNIASSVYNLTTASTNTYTVSLWVKVVQFPTKYGNTRSYLHQVDPNRPGTSGLVTKSKRAALARFDYSYSGTGTQYNGFIQFGAMAPYYKNASGTPNYKSIFSPISFGAAICCRHYQASVYTDYKFNLNQWYLLTIQLQSNSTFASSTQTLDVKMFVNNSQENIAKCLGIAWQQNKGIIRDSNGDYLRLQNAKRKTGLVAGQPGFYNCSTGGTVSNASSQSITYNYFMNLSRLNCISYSPILTFGGGIYHNVNNGNATPYQFGGYGSNLCQVGSSINFGQTYIYNTAFNSSLYTQFKGLYS
jgi:hypothetical protein